MEREKKIRKYIMIKGWDRDGSVKPEQIETFIKEKVRVEVKVIWCKQDGRVL